MTVKDVPIEPLFCISTEHLKPGTREAMTSGGITVPSNYPNEYGCFMTISREVLAQEVQIKSTWPDLWACIEWALDNDIQWLKFDPDGAQVPMLKRYSDFQWHAGWITGPKAAGKVTTWVTPFNTWEEAKRHVQRSLDKAYGHLSAADSDSKEALDFFIQAIGDLREMEPDSNPYPWACAITNKIWFITRYIE